jgi:hypothetical protein
MTASSTEPGSVTRSSAAETTGRMSPAPAAAALARTTSTMFGSWSTAHTDANRSDSAKLSCPVPQARSSSRPCPDGPVRRNKSPISAGA